MTNYSIAFWAQIQSNGYEIPVDQNLNTMIDELVNYLDSTDPQLRDEIGYMVLANWIFRELITADIIASLLTILLDKMTHHIGQVDDSVFGRSFSVLIIASIVEYDNKNHFLRADQFQNVLDATLSYFTAEKDVRGYIEGKGWAHSVAHTADCILHLSQSQHLSAKHLQDILMAIAMKVTDPIKHVYQHDEDERLALATIAVIERDIIPLSFYNDWLNAIVRPMLDAGFDIEMNAQVQNAKRYLRSLYIQLILSKNPADYIRAIRLVVLSAIQSTHRYIASS